MCLLGIAFQTLPDCPVFLLANREEDSRRQSLGPELVPDKNTQNSWLGGRDLQAGGTWLGVNRHGMIVAVTNRQKTTAPINPRSRGLLCRELLESSDLHSAQQRAEQSLRSEQYAGCNFLIADRDSLVVVEAGDELQISQASPGIHLMANAELNDPTDPRLARVGRLLRALNGNDPEAWIAEGKRICGLTGDDEQAAICRPGREWGTVSSTIITLNNPPQDSTYWFAPGPPSTTAYIDHSSQLQQLLCEGQTDMRVFKEK